MYQTFRRDLVLQYARQFIQVQNPIYADITAFGSNNVNFIYQLLENGGFYSKKPSQYLDVIKVGYYPSITRVDNILKALDEEIQAIKYVSTNINNLPGANTGDILMLTKDDYKTFYLIEYFNLQNYYYSQMPTIIRQQTLPQADEYSLYIIPDYIGEY